MARKDNGYKHPRTTPGSRIDDRRKRAAALLARCRAEHPQADGRCAVVHEWASPVAGASTGEEQG